MGKFRSHLFLLIILRICYRVMKPMAKPKGGPFVTKPMAKPKGGSFVTKRGDPLWQNLWPNQRGDPLWWKWRPNQRGDPLSRKKWPNQRGENDGQTKGGTLCDETDGQTKGRTLCKLSHQLGLPYAMWNYLLPSCSLVNCSSKMKIEKSRSWIYHSNHCTRQSRKSKKTMSSSPEN